MSDQKVWDMECHLDGEVIDYVEYSVNSWRQWISRAMLELDKIELKEIKLLTYFSIIEMMAQEYYNFPSKNQDTFTRFVCEFQNKYDYLELTDPITLYYRVESIVLPAITLNNLEDGSVYHPKAAVIREKFVELQSALTTEKGTDYADKKLKEHRYVDLLYRMRCRLSHEFLAPHISVSESETEPYYINWHRVFMKETVMVEDEIWQLSFPICFVKDLCINCFENYLSHCLNMRTPPNLNNGLDRICELSWYNR